VGHIDDIIGREDVEVESIRDEDWSDAEECQEEQDGIIKQVMRYLDLIENGLEKESVYQA